MQKIIACEVVIDAMRAWLPDGVATETLPMSLHTSPQGLRGGLQQCIDRADGIYDPIVLGFGLCSQATVGLRALRSRLVVVRSDDCIGMFLGSRDAYRQQLKQEPGTYFLTRGWTDGTSSTPFNEFERARARWGTERAGRLLQSMLRHYRRLVYIHSAGEARNSATQARARNIAGRFSLRFEVLEGQSALLEKLGSGPWDERFVLVPPGRAVKLEDFVC